MHLIPGACSGSKRLPVVGNLYYCCCAFYLTKTLESNWRQQLATTGGKTGGKKVLGGVAAGTGIAVLAANVLTWLWGV
jgi:hypothetical protein